LSLKAGLLVEEAKHRISSSITLATEQRYQANGKH